MMDPRLLRLYKIELQHLRESAAEFAAEHPKIASRLDLRQTECTDPYVERLLEGFAFLTSRIQLELENGQARTARHLLQVVAPHFEAPTPAMAIVRLRPSSREGSLSEGVRVPRGTLLRSRLRKGEQTPCTFRTAHEVTLWPIEVARARLLRDRRELAELGLAVVSGAESALQLTLGTTAGARFDALRTDELTLYLQGSDTAPFDLLEQLAGHLVRVVLRPPPGQGTWSVTLPGTSVVHAGLDDEDALLPYGRRQFSGHRLLHEYFALPERTLFVRLTGLAAAARRHVGGTELDVILLFDRRAPKLERGLQPAQFVPYCTPIVNLFPRSAARVQLAPDRNDYHVLVDRAKPYDYEVHSIESVVGLGSRAEQRVEFLPSYRLGARAGSPGPVSCWYGFDRRPRKLTVRERSAELAPRYTGAEVFVTVVDPNGVEAPYPGFLEQLDIGVLCTNRDLPTRIVSEPGFDPFSIESGAPVERIELLRGPTRPRPALPDSELAWRLVSHLSLHYLSLADSGDRREVPLREQLLLYADLLDDARGDWVRRQLQGLLRVDSRPMHARIPSPGPITFGRGLEIGLDFDEAAIESGSAFALSAVLERFFARAASVNSFTCTVLRSAEHGEITRWPTRIGQRKSV